MVLSNNENLPHKRAKQEEKMLKQAALDINEVSLAQTQQTADLVAQVANLEALVMSQLPASSDSTETK